MRRLVVIDTLGEQALHPTYRAALPHVTFVGHTPDVWRDGRGTVHPHGGWCAWHWLSQESEPIRCDLVQYLPPDGHPNAGANVDDWLFGTLKAQDLSPGDCVNCSWGSLGQGRFAWPWADRFIASIGQATVYWAAGNSGARTRSWPQVHMQGQVSQYIVGAIDRRGVRADFSSADSRPYVDCAGLGHEGMALDPFTGRIIAWSGTSMAAPNVGGALASNGVHGRDVIPFVRAHALGDDDGDGIPNGVSQEWRASLAAGIPHPEIGHGVVESLRQGQLRVTGRGLGTWSGEINGLALEMDGVRADIPPLEG